MGIHAFNLLSNHIHYLLEQTLDEVSPSKFIASIHTSLGHYTNRKYSRVGHLFQDRCKVKDIKEDEHLLAVSVYINLNKILERLEHLERLSISKDKLEGLFLEAEKDPWSSYPVYLGLRRDGITKTDFILSLICDNMKKAQKEYKKFAKHLVTSGYFIKTRDLVFE